MSRFQLTDEEAIRRTLASYCQACDDGRFDEFAALFAVDATFEVPPAAPALGRDAIRGFMETGYQPEVRGKHVLSEPLVDVDGDDATATTDFVFVGRSSAGAWVVKAAGRYHDTLRRTADGPWEFTRRLIAMM